MKEFKGTPGKWKYTVRNVNEMMTTFHGVTIGDTYIEAATRNEREDALLIAAAPDLLEALQELVFLYEHDEGGRELTEYKRAKAAISKALGGRMMNKKYIVEVIERETKEVIKHFEFDNYRKADRVEEGLLRQSNLEKFDVVMRCE